MALLVSNQGEEIALAALLNKTAPQDLDLCLFQNNYTPVETTTEADVTVATFTGYATIQLTAANWTITPGAPTEAAYAQQTFTSSAGSQNQSIYGYYLKQRTSGKLIYAERFSDGPYTIVNNGDAIKVTPKITAD
jgi:hypothetical protein